MEHGGVSGAAATGTRPVGPTVTTVLAQDLHITEASGIGAGVVWWFVLLLVKSTRCAFWFDTFCTFPYGPKD